MVIEKDTTWTTAPWAAPWRANNTLTHKVNELLRVFRCTDEPGTLNILPKIAISDAKLKQQYEIILNEIQNSDDIHNGNQWIKQHCISKICNAFEHLKCCSGR